MRGIILRVYKAKNIKIGVMITYIWKITKGPSKRLQHLLQHPFDFVEWQC